ncbi:uncharacterized protein LOC121442780, partial [Microtus oregoni]|uniref:uncharacterized protein LOC121442780 n=1 Tax=Microtus oregoni TaxID=111838 RepID=UPI001BB22CD5
MTCDSGVLIVLFLCAQSLMNTPQPQRVLIASLPAKDMQLQERVAASGLQAELLESALRKARTHLPREAERASERARERARTLREPPAPPRGPGRTCLGQGQGQWPLRSSRGGWGATGSGPRPSPARRLRWLGGGSAGLLLPAVLTCTQGRVTSPASPPLPAAASRRSVSAPEANLALWAPQSRGHGLADTFLRRGAAGTAAPGWAPSHHLAEGRPAPRDHRSGPSSEVRRTDGQTDRPHQRVPDWNCGQRQGSGGLPAFIQRVFACCLVYLLSQLQSVSLAPQC